MKKVKWNLIDNLVWDPQCDPQVQDRQAYDYKKYLADHKIHQKELTAKALQN